MTYRSAIFGGTLSMPVDMPQSDPSTPYFHVSASPSVIRTYKDKLSVTQDDIVVAREELSNSWLLY